jgi:zinc protease
MIARRRLLAVLVLGLAALGLGASADAATKIEQVTSPGGVQAWLVEDHANPIVAMTASFAGGASVDPIGKAGLAELVSDLLDEGAGDLDSQAFQGKLNDLAIEFGFGAGRDNFTVQVKTLTDNRETAFQLLGLALTKPRFDPDAVERVRGQLLTQLTEELENPNVEAARTLAALLFPNHPYGRPANGDPDSIKGLTRDDLVAWTAHHLGRDTLLVSVVGDVTPDQLKPLLDQAFGGLPAKADPVTVPDITPAGAGTLQVIHRPIPQSVADFAEPGIKRDDPDWYAALVMNYVLGEGGFSSRLMTEVRVKRGLAYTVGSYLGPREHTAMIGGSVGTRNDKMAESLAIIRQEWARMADAGVTEDELAAAKKYLNGSFPLELGSTSAIAGLLDAIQREHLGIDYLERRQGLIDAVTAADVQRVAHRLLQADKLAVIVVGDPKGMQ